MSRSQQITRDIKNQKDLKLSKTKTIDANVKHLETEQHTFN